MPALKPRPRAIIFLIPLLIIPFIPKIVPEISANTTNNVLVNLVLNYGNGTSVWYNQTSVLGSWNFYNVTSFDANGNLGALFFASFGSHFIYSINNAGCPASNIFCDEAWGFWTLDGVCWESAQVGVDQVPVSQVTTAGWILTPVAAFGQFPPTGVTCLAATIDVKPNDTQNVINIASQGSIPVAILTTSTFDATKVNPSTVRFGRTGTEAAPTQWALQDVNGDGTLDFVLHFNTQSTGLQTSDTQATLMGRTFTGTPFQGTDRVHVFLPR